ncbi:MAG: polyprenol monophosphomannose synthase [Anaerolineae bacterium]|nr:polyprenol monophosphomannose synthase [Anaerolineae bacterium]
MPKTVIVLPTYNEAENLPLMVDALLALPIANLNILVVDDNSPDGTGQIADTLVETHKGRMHVLHRAAKEGLGAAYRAGFKQALRLDADYIIQMDCDFSHQPSYVPLMVEAADRADLVLGSRYVKGGGVDESWSIYRKGLSWFANGLYVRTLLNVPIRDATGGFKLWRRETLIGLDLDRVRSNGYIFQVEMTYITHRLGFRITEIPIYFPDRERGHSKMGMKIAVEAALRVWQVLYRYHGLTPNMRRTEAYG